MVDQMSQFMPCSRCGQPTVGVELTPGCISAICRPGEGCESKPQQVKREERHAPRAQKKK